MSGDGHGEVVAFIAEGGGAVCSFVGANFVKVGDLIAGLVDSVVLDVGKMRGVATVQSQVDLFDADIV